MPELRTTQGPKLVSVVVPIFNEQDNLPALVHRLRVALDRTQLPWEVICVNDGSIDRSGQLIEELHCSDRRIKAISLSRNFGHQPAVTAGVHQARGDCVILIDGDLQDPPELIPDMVLEWQRGYQVVLAERRVRSDHGVRAIGFRLFYPLMRHISDLPHGPDAGIYGLMDRVVVDQFNKLPERNRFIPGLRVWLGFKQTSVLYDRQERAAGKPKQTLSRLLQYAVNGMLSFSVKPLRVATYAGFFVSAIAFAMAVYYFVTFFVYHKTFGSGFTTEIVSTLFLGGVQLICLGIVGEYLGRIYEEVKQRPLYVIRETLGLEKHQGSGFDGSTNPPLSTVT